MDSTSNPLSTVILQVPQLFAEMERIAIAGLEEELVPTMVVCNLGKDDTFYFDSDIFLGAKHESELPQM